MFIKNNQREHCTNIDNYLSCDSYLEFIINRIKHGEHWNAISSICKRIRKYTLVTTVLRTFVTLVALFEKSALFLLTATIAVLCLPIVLSISLVFAALNVICYLKSRQEITAWLGNPNGATVYITSGKFSCNCNNTCNSKRSQCSIPLFVRTAHAEAEQYTHPVILVCNGNFKALKWIGFNLLLVKPSCFFILKRYNLKNRNTVYVFVG